MDNSQVSVDQALAVQAALEETILPGKMAIPRPRRQTANRNL